MNTGHHIQAISNLIISFRKWLIRTRNTLHLQCNQNNSFLWCNSHSISSFCGCLMCLQHKHISIKFTFGTFQLLLSSPTYLLKNSNRSVHLGGCSWNIFNFSFFLSDQILLLLFCFFNLFFLNQCLFFCVFVLFFLHQSLSLDILCQAQL